MLMIYEDVFLTFVIHSSMFSLINCIVDLVFLDYDYERTHLVINEEKISKTQFTKQIILKHIPIFSIANVMCYMFHGKTFVEYKMKLEYDFENTEEYKQYFVRRFFRIIILCMVIQIIGSIAMYCIDSEINMIKDIEKQDGVKSVVTELTRSSQYGVIQYSTFVSIDGGSINYNRQALSEEYIINRFKDNLSNLKDKYFKRFLDVDVFSILIWDSETNIWDKYIYNGETDDVYVFENISSDIHNIYVYSVDDKVVYNISASSSEEELNWNVAEYLFNEFKDDVDNEDKLNLIRSIYGNDTDIQTYVFSITPKDYVDSKNSNYFMFTRNTEYDSWLHYDGKIYTSESVEDDFSNLVYIKYPNAVVKFKDLYNKGEIRIKDNTEVVSLDDIYELLDTEEGLKLKHQMKILGDVDSVSFILEEEDK